MKQTERGFLLLSSHLGDPERRCLTTAQLRMLAQRARDGAVYGDTREMIPEDLIRLGYGRDMAERIVGLLEEEWRLDAYLARGRLAGCGVLSRVSDRYPQALRVRLGQDMPGSLWYKGDPALLEGPKAALVGSRDILPRNLEFAREAGIQAARQGYTLVSGNARGADRAAQDACLEAGGSVISVLADSLAQYPQQENILYLSEDGFDLAFSPQRALSRNRVIHALVNLSLVAQCSWKTGGTWDGTLRNLQNRWSKVCCYDDGSKAMTALGQMGAELISPEQLGDFTLLAEQEPNFLI